MITSDMADFFIHVIDLEVAARGNNMEEAKRLCEIINGMELDDIEARQVNDAVSGGIYGSDSWANDTTRYLLKNLKCVQDKEELLKQLDVIEAIASKDKEKCDELLERVVKPGMFDGDYDHRRYARSLITLSRMTNRYDKMDEIRQHLEEAK